MKISPSFGLKIALLAFYMPLMNIWLFYVTEMLTNHAAADEEQQSCCGYKYAREDKGS